MEAAFIEPVTVEDIMGIATWNRPRSSDELHAFVESRHASLPADLLVLE